MRLSLTPFQVGILMALGAVLGWSFNFIFSRSLAGLVPPFTFTLMRTIVALLVFAPFGARPFLRCWPYFRKRPVLYILLALTGIGYYNALMYCAGRTTTALNMALLALSSSIFTLLLARIFCGEALTPRRLFGLGAALCGVILLTLRGDPALLQTLDFHIGDLIVLLGAFLFACYNVSLRRIDPQVDTKAFLFALFAICTVFLLPPSALELAIGMQVHLTPLVITGTIYLGTVASIFCYLCWNGAIKRIGASNTALMYYTLPLFCGIEAVFLLGEPLRWFHFVSGALIIAGVLVATRK